MSYLGGAKWNREPSSLALGGEAILSKLFGGMVWLDGLRCPRCRLLHPSYQRGLPRATLRGSWVVIPPSLARTESRLEGPPGIVPILRTVRRQTGPGLGFFSPRVIASVKELSC
jgi:hypothetical protein